MVILIKNMVNLSVCPSGSHLPFKREALVQMFLRSTIQRPPYVRVDSPVSGGNVRVADKGGAGSAELSAKLTGGFKEGQVVR